MTRYHRARDSRALEMFLHRPASGFLYIRFGRGARCRALISRAPVIKHPRQMLNLLRSNLFYAAQRQIIILRAFEPDAETTEPTDQVGSVNAEMRNEILRQKQLRVPIRLKIRLRPSILCIELILVAVEQLQIAVF